jgi:hypothetical protein
VANNGDFRGHQRGLQLAKTEDFFMAMDMKRMAYGFVNAANFEARGILLTPPKPIT